MRLIKLNCTTQTGNKQLCGGFQGRTNLRITPYSRGGSQAILSLAEGFRGVDSGRQPCTD